MKPEEGFVNRHALIAIEHFSTCIFLNTDSHSREFVLSAQLGYLSIVLLLLFGKCKRNSLRQTHLFDKSDRADFRQYIAQ